MLVIYALGGGWGHLTRAVALACLAPDRITIFTNSPYAGQIRAAEPHVVIEDIVDIVRGQVVSRIRALAPTVLLVDTFPRGLGGELADALPSIAARKILVHRDLEPAYVEWGNLREFVARFYDLVLVPGEGEGTAFRANAVITEPWLVRTVEDLRGSHLSSILISAGGNVDEMCWYGEVASRIPTSIDFRCIAPMCPPGCPLESWVPYWPAIEWIAGAKVVIGSGGYNTVYECQACGVPLIAKAWPRKYDRQQRRAAHHAATCVNTPAEAVQAALQTLAQNKEVPRGPGGPPFQAASLLL